MGVTAAEDEEDEDEDEDEDEEMEEVKENGKTPLKQVRSGTGSVCVCVFQPSPGFLN